MPMTDQEVDELKKQYADLMQGVMTQRNAAMDEQVNLGAIIRATSRERDALKQQVATLTEQIAKMTAPADPPQPPAPSVDPSLLNGASPAAIAAATGVPSDGAVQPAA